MFIMNFQPLNIYYFILMVKINICFIYKSTLYVMEFIYLNIIIIYEILNI